MKLISWNVNGIRAAMKKGLLDYMNKESADVFCFQEIKINDKDMTALLPSIIEGLKDTYEFVWYPAQKSGYSGVMTATKQKPKTSIKGVDVEEFDNEGRVLTTELDNFYVVNCYFPNTQRGLDRMEYKLKFNDMIGGYCDNLRKTKPVIITGDFNVAHTELDIKNAKQNEKNAGFTIEERDSFTKFLSRGYIDTFRVFEKGPGFYTWWAYFANARAKDIGWRIDYFIVSKELEKNLISAGIQKDVMGSDHCPVTLEVK